jgi:hypothetical protein
LLGGSWGKVKGKRVPTFLLTLYLAKFPWRTTSGVETNFPSQLKIINWVHEVFFSEMLILSGFPTIYATWFQLN